YAWNPTGMIENVGVWIDDQFIGQSDSGPFQYRRAEQYFTLPFRVSSLANGLHTLRVELRDGSGQIHTRSQNLLVFGDENNGELIVDGEGQLGDISYDINRVLYSFQPP